ncbi:sigma factor-like helix-turn-helix DNA-binding protein [Streptomyces sp. TS71-3]|uniref:sigma factor-like helix-turn-helix DNA-binding protein n=1 Tax=Streptomyces sp. TS71-3 TaxID=2733862 RepID=UPI002017738C|nr:sigma factor-like helix-turn-helix DNA-binding protein [Streptomyces sp. TS71-3]
MSRDTRRAREFESFVAGAAGRLLHAATLLTAEPPDDNPRARRLLVSVLAHTYATWDGLRGEDPYERARQQLAVRFARGVWHHRRTAPRPDADSPSGWSGPLRTWAAQAWAGPWRGRPERTGAERSEGVLHGLTPQERLVLVLRMYEGVAEEQTAALLGLSTERVYSICARAMSNLLHPPSERPASLPKVVPS